MTVTDLTVTGFVPMFATLHSALFNADPIPVEITAAWLRVRRPLRRSRQASASLGVM